MVNKMQTTADVIERLAKEITLRRVIMDMRECNTIEDYKELEAKYEKEVEHLQ